MILDFILVAFLLILMLISAKRGLFKKLLHVARLVLSTLAAYCFGTNAAVLIRDRWIGPAVYELMHGQIAEISAKLAGDFNVADITSVIPKFVLSDELIAKLEALEGSGETYVHSISETVATPVANTVSLILGHVSVFAVTLLLVGIFALTLNKWFAANPTAAAVNRFLGGVWGLFLGVILASVACGILDFLFRNSDFYANAPVAKFFGQTVAPKVWEWFRLPELSVTELLPQ